MWCFRLSFRVVNKAILKSSTVAIVNYKSRSENFSRFCLHVTRNRCQFYPLRTMSSRKDDEKSIAEEIKITVSVGNKDVPEIMSEGVSRKEFQQVDFPPSGTANASDTSSLASESSSAFSISSNTTTTTTTTDDSPSLESESSSKNLINEDTDKDISSSSSPSCLPQKTSSDLSEAEVDSNHHANSKWSEKGYSKGENKNKNPLKSKQLKKQEKSDTTSIKSPDYHEYRFSDETRYQDSSNSSDDQKVNSTKSEGRLTRQSFHKHQVEQCKEKYLSMDLHSKRKLYRSKYTTLHEIFTWPQLYQYNLRRGSQGSRVDSHTDVEIREDLNSKISVFTGDITSLEIDAIVNAANESLLGGGGVDGAIHRAAGSYLRDECELLHGCLAGEAKITCGYNLPAKYVIHTVGPRREYPEVLAQCYSNCLDLVRDNKLSTVAFPCISTGVFGYPNLNAAKVVLKTIREWLEQNEYASEIQRIIFCLFLKVDENIYESLLPKYFPIEHTAQKMADKNRSSKVPGSEESASDQDQTGSKVPGSEESASDHDQTEVDDKHEDEQRKERKPGKE